MDMKSKIKNREDFSFKFADAPFDTNGVLNPGWAEPTYDDFFTRMVEEPVLLNQSTVIPMTALQHDLDMLTAEVELDSQRDSSGNSTYLTAPDVAPNMGRKQLIAKPMQAKRIISDNFLEENIEGEEFLTTYMNLLADEMGPAFERFGLFADSTVSHVTGEGTSYQMGNGIISQLKTISSDTSKEEYGLAKLVYKDNVGQGIFDAIERYIEQDGDIDKATCVLPPQIHARLMIEIAQDRQTNWGDAVFQDGKVTKILGIEIVSDNILRNTRNGYDTMKFNSDGEYKGNGSNMTKMKYGIIGKPENIVFGMMRDFDIRNQWDIDVLGYKVALLCKGDVQVLWDQDTLGIPFTMNNKE